MADDKNVTVYTPGQEWGADVKAKPADLVKTLQELEIIAPHQAAKDLIGQTFQIRAAQAVESELKEGSHYYFCACVDMDTGEKFTTTLGGQVITELIDAYIGSGQTAPMVVTLRFAEGKGLYDGYYYVE
jgi:hypothetical protein